MPVGSIARSATTRIVEQCAPHPTRNTVVCVARELLHYGKTIVGLQYDNTGTLYGVHVTIDYNSASSRAKINKFLATYARQLNLSVCQHKGKLCTVIAGKREEFAGHFSMTNVGRTA